MSNADGAPVELAHSGIDESYSYGSHAGNSLFEFDIVDPGMYRLECALPDTSAQGVVAVGKGMKWSSFLFGLLGAPISVVIGVLFIVFGYRRSRPPPRFPPGYSPGPGPGSPPQPPQ